MKYVLDASVAIKRVIVEPDSDKATGVREDYRNAIHDLIAPESFAIECAYSLTKTQRQKLLPDARALWDEIMLDASGFNANLPLVDRAFDISTQHRHNFYDCLDVALAEREGCELLTLHRLTSRSGRLSFRQPGNRRIGGDPNRAALETCSPAIQIGLLGRAIGMTQ